MSKIPISKTVRSHSTAGCFLKALRVEPLTGGPTERRLSVQTELCKQASKHEGKLCGDKQQLRCVLLFNYAQDTFRASILEQIPRHIKAGVLTLLRDGRLDEFREDAMVS